MKRFTLLLCFLLSSWEMKEEPVVVEAFVKSSTTWLSPSLATMQRRPPLDFQGLNRYDWRTTETAATRQRKRVLSLPHLAALTDGENADDDVDKDEDNKKSNDKEPRNQSSSSSSRKKDAESTYSPPIVTKEMFLRELMRDPAAEDNDNDNNDDDNELAVTVKRNSSKKKGSGVNSSTKKYKVLDNRDTLPFAVQVATPDPYTHPDEKRRNMVRAPPKPRKDAVEETVASTLYFYKKNNNNSKDDNDNKTSNKKKKNKKGKHANNNDDDDDILDPNLRTWLGEFHLDRMTTTGDLLEIGDTAYKVIRHRCQYKYAGGQRFVMVRKILEVKEVGRLLTEEYLHRQWSANHN